MPRTTRREFLRQVAFGLGAVATAQIGEQPDLPLAAYQESQAPDGTTWLEGTVSSIENGTLIIRNGWLSSVLFITDQTRLWKGKVTSVDQVELEDYIYAVGLARPEGGFTAVKAWVNIANFYGTVADTNDGGMRLRIGSPGFESFLTVHIGADTLLNEVPGIEPAITAALSEGQFVQVLGVYQRDGSLVSTRIWTAQETE